MNVKFKIILLSTLLFFIMCKVNNAQDSLYPEQFVNANYKKWIGGRDAVRGINYEFSVITDQNIKILKVIINNHEQEFRIENLSDGIKIHIEKTFVQEPIHIGKDKNSTIPFEDYNPDLPAFMIYTINDSSIEKKIILPKFTQKDIPHFPKTK